MKILFIHNRYAIGGRGSGEEVMIDVISNLLIEKGHDVNCYIKDSCIIEKKFLGKYLAFFSGIYNVFEKKKLEDLLTKQKPDLVFVQNVFPLLSPSILISCKKNKIPVVMRCPNYRLLCPNGLFLRNGKLCEDCAVDNELQCILHNCEESIFKSVGYALRSIVARKFSLFKNNVDVFMVLTEFAKKKLIDNGFLAEQIQIISGIADQDGFKANIENVGTYVGLAGRVSSEKGIDLLLTVAENNPDIPFKIAGNFQGFEVMVNEAPENVEFLGQLNKSELNKFYENSKIILSTSRCYEGLPVVLIEAMLCAKPVICSNLGGLPEIVSNCQTGFLCKSDDMSDFSKKIKKLWNNNELCIEFGIAGRRKAESDYGPEAFYNRLIKCFNLAIDKKKLMLN